MREALPSQAEHCDRVGLVRWASIVRRDSLKLHAPSDVCSPHTHANDSYIGDCSLMCALVHRATMGVIVCNVPRPWLRLACAMGVVLEVAAVCPQAFLSVLPSCSGDILDLHG